MPSRRAALIATPLFGVPDAEPGCQPQPQPQPMAETETEVVAEARQTPSETTEATDVAPAAPAAAVAVAAAAAVSASANTDGPPPPPPRRRTKKVARRPPKARGGVPADHDADEELDTTDDDNSDHDDDDDEDDDGVAKPKPPIRVAVEKPKEKPDRWSFRTGIIAALGDLAKDQDRVKGKGKWVSFYRLKEHVRTHAPPGFLLERKTFLTVLKRMVDSGVVSQEGTVVQGYRLTTAGVELLGKELKKNGGRGKLRELTSSELSYAKRRAASLSRKGQAKVQALSVINAQGLGSLPPHVKPILYDPRQESRRGGNGNQQHHVYTYRGVCRQARKSGHDRWQSQISFGGTNHYLGIFDSEWDAAAIYSWAHLILYGEEATRKAQREGEEAAAAYVQEKKEELIKKKKKKKKKKDKAAGKVLAPPPKPALTELTSDAQSSTRPWKPAPPSPPDRFPASLVDAVRPILGRILVDCLGREGTSASNPDDVASVLLLRPGYVLPKEGYLSRPLKKRGERTVKNELLKAELIRRTMIVPPALEGRPRYRPGDYSPRCKAWGKDKTVETLIATPFVDPPGYRPPPVAPPRVAVAAGTASAKKRRLPIDDGSRSRKMAKSHF